MLALNDVNAGYGGFQALFGVSLQVDAGEAVAVIGPNGAGKTTLMRVISGLTPAKSGTITERDASVCTSAKSGSVIRNRSTGQPGRPPTDASQNETANRLQNQT